jgi:hypothetical protein
MRSSLWRVTWLDTTNRFALLDGETATESRRFTDTEGAQDHVEQVFDIEGPVILPRMGEPCAYPNPSCSPRRIGSSVSMTHHDNVVRCRNSPHSDRTEAPRSGQTRLASHVVIAMSK